MLEVTYWRQPSDGDGDDEQIARNVQPLQVEPGQVQLPARPRRAHLRRTGNGRGPRAASTAPTRWSCRSRCWTPGPTWRPGAHPRCRCTRSRPRPRARSPARCSKRWARRPTSCSSSPARPHRRARRRRRRRPGDPPSRRPGGEHRGRRRRGGPGDRGRPGAERPGGAVRREPRSGSAGSPRGDPRRRGGCHRPGAPRDPRRGRVPRPLRRPLQLPGGPRARPLAGSQPTVAVLGGMASAARAAGGNRLVLDGSLHADGAVGVPCPPASPPRSWSARGAGRSASR